MLTDTQSAPPPHAAAVLYQESFQSVEIGEVPEDFLVLEGEFAVRDMDGNRVLELPGEPLSTFGLLFGPSEKEDMVVRARFSGTPKGRRYPSFGVGLGGASGYRLMVSAGKETLEVFEGEEPRADVAYRWAPQTWTNLLLQVRRTGEGRWSVEGKAWPHAEPEPDEWMVGLEIADQPPTGRASLWGAPFAGTPIQFDDLILTRLSGT